MIEVLRSGRGCRQGELASLIRRDPYFNRNFTEPAVYVLIGQAVRLYEEDFYRDPSTGRIHLTRGRLEVERARRAMDRLRSAPPGTTHCARIAAALEAAD
jgi:hypothetical protein